MSQELPFLQVLTPPPAADAFCASVFGRLPLLSLQITAMGGLGNFTFALFTPVYKNSPPPSRCRSFSHFPPPEPILKRSSLKPVKCPKPRREMPSGRQPCYVKFCALLSPPPPAPPPFPGSVPASPLWVPCFFFLDPSVHSDSYPFPCFCPPSYLLFFVAATACDEQSRSFGLSLFFLRTFPPVTRSKSLARADTPLLCFPPNGPPSKAEFVLLL